MLAIADNGAANKTANSAKTCGVKMSSSCADIVIVAKPALSPRAVSIAPVNPAVQKSPALTSTL